MFGLNLIHAGFLAAGLAVAIPILIHLLFRQKTRKVAIGSLRFVHQLVREHRRKRRVRQWILLALRMFALALLAVLFARPYWNDARRAGLEQEVVLLVDRSASMQAREAGGASAFDRALERARGELGRLDENTAVHVALFDATGVNEIPVQMLSGAAPTLAATDYAAALGWAGDLLAGSQRRVRQILLYTDLQRNALPSGPVPALLEGIDLIVKDVGQNVIRNLAIESAEAVHTELGPDRPVLVRVILRNHSPGLVRGIPVECKLTGPAGQLSAKKSIDIAAQARAVVELPVEATADGVYRGEVAIESDDLLALDNRRYLAFEARHPERVLLVDGEEGRSVYENETYYLETALRLTTEETERSLRSFEPEHIIWEAGVGFPRLDGYRVIVLANVRRLSDNDAARLRSFLEAGGRLLIFAGEQSTRESLRPLAEARLLPGELAGSAPGGRWRVDEWNAEHPALKCFHDPQQGDLRRVVFERIQPIGKLQEQDRPLLKSAGKIVAAERPVGRGLCLYFGSTADREWTDLPRSRMYVPLMRQLMAYLTDQISERRLVAERLVSKPGESAGVVQFEDRWIVTNIDPRESALDRAAVEEIEQAFGSGEPTTEDAEKAAAWAAILPGDRLRPEEIWTTVAWILLIVLSGEMLLASRVHA
jgi:hypothetical protein